MGPPTGFECHHFRGNRTEMPLWIGEMKWGTKSNEIEWQWLSLSERPFHYVLSGIDMQQPTKFPFFIAWGDCEERLSRRLRILNSVASTGPISRYPLGRIHGVSREELTSTSLCSHPISSITNLLPILSFSLFLLTHIVIILISLYFLFITFSFLFLSFLFYYIFIFIFIVFITY